MNEQDVNQQLVDLMEKEFHESVEMHIQTFRQMKIYDESIIPGLACATAAYTVGTTMGAALGRENIPIAIQNNGYIIRWTMNYLIRQGQ